MKSIFKLFGTYSKSHFLTQKRFMNKRKRPINPAEAENLPIFHYPVAKSTDRRVYVCGLAETGALGIYLPETNKLKKQKNKILYSNYQKRIQFGEKYEVKDITCGYGFTAYSVKSSDCNQVFGTGLNTDSQIGYHAPRRFSPLEMLLYPAPITLPLKKPETTKVIALSAGRAHLVIVTDNEGVFTLGNNAYGQCGRKIIPNENYNGSMLKHQITSIAGEKVVNAQCGQDHSMFITESGKVYTCGWGSDGQLGNGDYSTSWNPRKVIGDIENERIIKLSCTADCVLALNDKGDVFGWGNTEYGQLNHSNESTQQINVSRALTVCKGLGKIIDIASGGSFCLILNENGDVYSWGYGLLGKGPAAEQSYIPLQIPQSLFGKNEFNPDSKVAGVACGLSHMVAFTNSGDLYTWGRNKHGCLGLGHLKDQFFPLKSSLGAKVIKVSCGVDHTVSLCKPFV